MPCNYISQVTTTRTVGIRPIIEQCPEPFMLHLLCLHKPCPGAFRLSTAARKNLCSTASAFFIRIRSTLKNSEERNSIKHYCPLEKPLSHWQQTRALRK